MRLGLVWGISFFAVLFLLPSRGVAASPVVQMLQVCGTRRPLELATRAGEPLDLARVEGDVRRLWATGWFDDIQVESSETAEGVHLVFTLVEKPRLYLRRIIFDPPGERRPLGLEEGVPVDKTSAAKVAQGLRRQLAEEGYADARVEAQLVRRGFDRADVRLKVNRGRHYRIREVRFEGQLGLKPKELRQALRATRTRRLLPGLGPLWRGWRILAPFSEERLQEDIERLRSLYFSRGYFDAQVEVARVNVANGKATLTIQADSGLQYRVRRVELAGAHPAHDLSPDPDGILPSRRLCDCLLEALRASEKRGEVPFAARLLLESPSEAPNSVEGGEESEAPSGRDAASASWVVLKAEVTSGPPHHVGRIEFQGHHAVSDSTLRRALVLHEGDLFDQGKLRQSLARLSQLGVIKPLTDSDVRVQLERDRHQVNLTIPVKENPRGRWSLTGPLGPVSALGPLAFSIASRLPGVGQGPLELSTYRAEFSLLAWPQLVSLWPFKQRTRWLPLLAIERPYLPGQWWQSGFVLAPQLGWEGTAATYAHTHTLLAARAVLDRGTPPGPGFAVPASWRTAGSDASALPIAGLLRCEPHRSTWAWFRDAGLSIADLAGKWLLTASLL